MTTDFNFYLNTQGIRGKKGDKGDAGFAPSITVGQNTLNTFTLLITTADGTFETPNLRGSIISGSGVGTFLAYNQGTDTIYLTDLPIATPEASGVARLASEEEIASGSGDGVVTVSDLDDFVSSNLYDYLVAGDNIQLSVDSETGKVTISASLDNVPVATTTSLGVVQPDGTTILIDGNGVISAVAGHDDHEQVVQNTADISELKDNKEDTFVTTAPLYKETTQNGTVRGFTYSSTNNTVTTDGYTTNIYYTDYSTGPGYINLDSAIAGTRGIFSNYNLGDIVRIPKTWGVAFGNANNDGIFKPIVLFLAYTGAGNGMSVALPDGKSSNFGRNIYYGNTNTTGPVAPSPSRWNSFNSGLDISSTDSDEYHICQLTQYDADTLKFITAGAVWDMSGYTKRKNICDIPLQEMHDSAGDINTIVLFPSLGATSTTNATLIRRVRIDGGISLVGTSTTFSDIENASNLLNLGSSYTTHFLSVDTATVDNFGVVKPDGTTITISNGVISSAGGTGAVSSVNGQTGNVVLTASDVDALPDSTVIPTVNDATITFTQGGVTKGSFTTNQSSGATIALDAGGSGSSIEVYYE